ncbi:MAG: transposase [Verrucomicrobia bacterium]|nr:transposase [Verrucomicrobiota bacterium]
MYHLTHRCHDRQFLLKFARDRDAYRRKLWQGVGEFDLSLLDYSVTSNHVHLLACAENTEQISRFIQRVDGEFAQIYNRRNHRSGAYWEDRFHSTMIEPGGHLEACMVYIALNMVRCRAVPHPRQWPWCGYHELMGLRQRYRIVDIERILAMLGGTTLDEVRRHYEAMIQERIAKDEMKRDSKWTEAIAVGSKEFVRQMASCVRGRQELEIQGAGDTWALKELGLRYGAFLGPKTGCSDDL